MITSVICRRPINPLFRTVAMITGLGLFVTILACTAPPRNVAGLFKPQSQSELAKGSRKLDVPYVVTHLNVVTAMLDLAAVKADEFLIDLGSGDGRINIMAATHYGARGVGVDLNPRLVELSRQHALKAGIGDRVDFFVKDLFLTDIGRADVVTIYLLPEVNLKLRSKLLNELKPGARVVSQDFHMETWRPDAIWVIKDEKGEERILYRWIIPVRVGGRWQWQIPVLSSDQHFTLNLNQHFQDIEGSALNQDIHWRIFDQSLVGDQIRFSMVSEADDRIVRQDYHGQVCGDIIQGTVRLSGAAAPEELEWLAERLID